MYTCLHVKYPLFLSGSNKTWKFLDRYSKYRLIPHFNQIRPAFSDFAQARDESSEFDVWQNGAWRDRCDMATRWRNSGNTEQSYWQWLWVNHTALQSDVRQTTSGRARQQCVWWSGEDEPALISFLKQLLSRIRQLSLRISTQWRAASQKLPNRLQQDSTTSENFTLLD